MDVNLEHQNIFLSVKQLEIKLLSILKKELTKIINIQNVPLDQLHKLQEKAI